MKRARTLVVVAAVAMCGWRVFAQATAAPTNDLPNPYQTIANNFKLPEGRTWGSTSAVDIDKDGRSIWVGERCGTTTKIGAPFSLYKVTATTQTSTAGLDITGFYCGS